ncbi:MAG TPA: hypothetical protein VJ455_08990 [Ignavibacteria bacterium]|nr:hypothetical protein [Ignavibacteria bacterium]
MKFSVIALILAPIVCLNLFVSNPTNTAFSQFKEIPKETKSKLNTSSGLILGFINPKNFSIEHSVNLSYATFGDASYSLASYTARLNYKVLDNLKLSADVTMQYSPFASLGAGNTSLNKDFQNSLNGINLSRVSLQYKPMENMFINIDYINNNNMYWNNNYYYNRFWDYNH